MTTMKRTGGFAGAVAAEWTKLWSVRATWWCLISGTALMFLYSTASGIAQRYDGDRPTGAHTIALGGGFYLTQFTVIALSTLFVTSEYSSGGIRSTLLWTPVREHVALAKAAILVPVLFVFGAGLSPAAMALASVLKDGHGLPTSLAEGLTAALGTGAYYALLGVLCTGFGWALRSAAGALVAVLVLLLPLPVVLASFGLTAAVDYFPGIAGVNGMLVSGAQNPVTGQATAYAPWVGVLICAAWAAAALLGGTTVLRRRDA